MRLFLISGLSELLACAALQKAHLAPKPAAICFHGHPVSIPEELRRQTLALSGLFGDWTAVHDASGVTNAVRTQNIRSLETVVGLVRRILPEDGVTEIVLNALDKPFEAAVLSLYDQADVIHYDNGIVSHVSRTVVLGRRRNTDLNAVAGADLERVSHAYFTLFERLPIPSHLHGTPVGPISPDALRSVAMSVYERSSGLFPAEASEPSTLLLATSFYRGDASLFNRERAAYKRAVADIRAKGRGKIYFKEHPRALAEGLLDASDGVEIIDTRLPIEIWAAGRAIETAISISSTALFTLEMLYGVKGWVIGHEIETIRNYPHVRLLTDALPAWRFG